MSLTGQSDPLSLEVVVNPPLADFHIELIDYGLDDLVNFLLRPTELFLGIIPDLHEIWHRPRERFG